MDNGQASVKEDDVEELPKIGNETGAGEVKWTGRDDSVYEVLCRPGWASEVELKEKGADLAEEQA